MRRRGLCFFAGIAAALLEAAPGFAAAAQGADFIVSEHGKQVGTASFHLAAGPEGYESESLVRVAMEGLDYALSKNEELTSANALRRVQLSATVNNQAVSVNAKPDAAH